VSDGRTGIAAARAAGESDLRQGAALVEVGAFEVIRARGADRVAFLHRLTTGRIEALTPGQGTRSLLLTVKGQTVADLRVCASADEMHIIVPPAQGEVAAAALSRYAVMDDFTATLDRDLALVAVHGPRSEDRLRESGLEVPAGLLGQARWAHAEVSGPEGGSFLVVRERAVGEPGLWVFGPAPEVVKLRDRLSAAGVGTLPGDLAEVLRLRAGEPRYGAEITDDYFPMEVGLTSAIDYTKGCYLGQEPIVRIRDRGHFNWRLVRLRAQGDGQIAAGDRLEADSKPRAGRITSAARLPGQPAVALGLLHLSVPAGTVVRILPATPPDGAAGEAAAPTPIPAEVEEAPDDA
jgi:tRNA-modifying protein YgfZ